MARKWTSPSNLAKARFSPLLADAVALFFAPFKPRFRFVANPFERSLHLRLLAFHRFAVRVGGNADGRRHEHHRAGEWIGQPKEVPRFRERVRPLEPDVEHGDGPSRAPRQNHRA